MEQKINFEVTQQAAQILMQLVGNTPTNQGLYPLLVELNNQYNAQVQAEPQKAE